MITEINSLRWSSLQLSSINCWCLAAERICSAPSAWHSYPNIIFKGLAVQEVVYRHIENKGW